MSDPSNAETDRLPAGATIGRSALRVSDLEETTEFYRTVVGLRVLSRSDATAVLGVEGTPLLVLERDSDAQPRHRSATGLYHNAFWVPSREALGDALNRIRDRWHLGGASDHGVSEALYCTDPEGNGVEIYRDYPRESWPSGDDNPIRMTTEPLDLATISAAAAGDEHVPAGTDVGHVHLEVSSLESFRTFYVDVLGFEVTTTVPGAVFVSAGGYHHHLGANTWHHRTASVDGRGLSWLEVLLPEASDLEALQDRLESHNVQVTKREEGISVDDPDGIQVRCRVGSPT
ncbi:VOC family protein [Natronosalvus vescus]|uniref:VOC family protein n=1 Tax=Natronosalvus vescus TaxID=2953881 RepID=UPI002090EA6A|nr:VOC family protein [Natronosalvus vescus]